MGLLPGGRGKTKPKPLFHLLTKRKKKNPYFQLPNYKGDFLIPTMLNLIISHLEVIVDQDQLAPEVS